jgi:hypothetical protein
MEGIMVGEIYAGISSFKVMLDIAKGLKDLSDASARYAAVIELQEKILGAQEAQTALIQKVGELEKEVTQFKNWDAEKQRYELKDIGQGSLAYALKAGMQPSQVEHYLCANCFEQSKKRILQREKMHVGRAIAYVCDDCDSMLYVQGHYYPDHTAGRPRR